MSGNDGEGDNPNMRKFELYIKVRFQDKIERSKSEVDLDLFVMGLYRIIYV